MPSFSDTISRRSWVTCYTETIRIHIPYDGDLQDRGAQLPDVGHHED
jgi:hypothetical protein